MRKLLPFFSILWILFLFTAPPQTWASHLSTIQLFPRRSSVVISQDSITTYRSYPRRTLLPTQNTVPTPTPTVKPTATPTPKPLTTAPSGIQKSTEAPTTTSSSSTVQDYIMDQINAYRVSKGLPTVSKDPYTCGFAKTRAQEISTAFNHDGFTNRINNRTLPYPSYTSITENIAMTSNYKEVVSMWINSSGHAANMRKDTPYVCVEQHGNYYAYEGWKP